MKAREDQKSPIGSSGFASKSVPTAVENLSKTRAQRVEKLCEKKNLSVDPATFVAKSLHERRFVFHFACARCADA